MSPYRESLRQSWPECWKWIGISHHIQGWLTDGEAGALFRLAHQTPDCDPVIVELGSWQGKSSVLLAAGLRQKTNPRLYCIDPFGSDENPEYQEKHYKSLIDNMKRSQREGFDRNIRRCGLQNIVQCVQRYSFSAVKGWSTPIDFLFIDANHEYESVLRDFLDWSPFLRPGGIIAFHDVSEFWPGPSRVVREQLPLHGFGSAFQVDSVAWAFKEDVSK